MQSIRVINKHSISKSIKSFSNAAERPSLGGFWMPFTDHDRFKKNPKMFARADGVFYYTEDGREIYDGASGLWCVNAGHNNKKIVSAVKEQLGKLDFAPCFNAGHRLPITMAEKLLETVPNRNFQEVFFTMCGSTAVDTALKIALAYQRARGLGQKVKLIGRERGYHGVNFGGMSFYLRYLRYENNIVYRYQCGWNYAKQKTIFWELVTKCRPSPTYSFSKGYGFF